MNFLNFLNENERLKIERFTSFDDFIKEKNLIWNDVVYDLSNRIKYFIPNQIKNEFYIIAFHDELIIGIAGLEFNPYTKKPKSEVWIKFVSVDGRFRKIGIATKLIEEIFKWSEENKWILSNSSYTELGKLYLKNIFEKISNKYKKVKFKESKWNF